MAMASNAHQYDYMSRTGPKHLVGEFAVTQGSLTGTLADAFGEAAFRPGRSATPTWSSAAPTRRCW